MSPQTFLINLKRSTDRLAIIKGFLDRFGVDYERVEAVDAQTLSYDVYASVSAPNVEYPHHMKPGEIACFLSHRNCWQKLVESGQDWALILEDHCHFSSRAERYLKSTDWIPAECEIIQIHLSDNPFYSNRRINLEDGNALLNIVCSAARRSSAYFISRRAAQVALEESNKITCPLDNFIFGTSSAFSKKIVGWRLLGAIARRDVQTKTTILGRGSKNKGHNKERFYPQRILMKLRMKIQRLLLNKHFQFWLD